MLRVQDDDAVRAVTLDRPAARNALTPDALDDLRDAVAGAAQPVVYVHGAGDAFCAGADLDTVRGLDGEGGAAFARRGQRTMNAIEDADSVVVAGVDGAARGGGVELALACDVRVATPDASFAETGVTLGLFGAWGGTRRLQRAVGATHAADLSLSGRTVDADAARDVGLVSRVVEDPRAVADEIADNDAAALRELNALLADDADRETTDRREAEAFGRLLAADPFED
ncbi:enoyl-CoA hydratase/isomerase family protein [Halobacterium yunchengense]|uniref:enoyl-CoA hydratase/isomerase family protein n=1 Tax=Halobacterium yunchengense TaxID=3108497 RepID=UPI00300BA138